MDSAFSQSGRDLEIKIGGDGVSYRAGRGSGLSSGGTALHSPDASAEPALGCGAGLWGSIFARFRTSAGSHDSPRVVHA